MNNWNAYMLIIPSRVDTATAGQKSKYRMMRAFSRSRNLVSLSDNGIGST